MCYTGSALLYINDLVVFGNIRLAFTNIGWMNDHLSINSHSISYFLVRWRWIYGFSEKAVICGVW